MWPLHACADRREAGRKAQLLARARALGLPVQPGLVIPADDPLPQGDDPALLQALQALGPGPFVVRSSSAEEDLPGRSAAGLFLTLTRVLPEDVAAAVAEVRRSGQDEAVRAYLGRPAQVPVLIQPQVQAERLGVLRFQAGEPVLCEERPPGEPEWGSVAVRVLEESPTDRLLAQGAAALAGLLAQDGAALVEYALLPDGEVTFLQVRPGPPDPAPRDEAAAWPAPDPQQTYLLDHEHNPDPLSAAQISLVELADEMGFRQAVRHGYLYYRAEVAPSSRTSVPPSSSSVPPWPVLLPGELRRRFEEEVVPACEAELLPLEASLDQVPLPVAIAAYFAVYRRYMGQVAPAIRGARARLDALLWEGLGERLHAHADLLDGPGHLTASRTGLLYAIGKAAEDEAAAHLAAYQRRFGAYAPCWDVSAPCDDERPQRVRALALAVARGPDPAEAGRQAEARAKQAAQAVRARLPLRLHDRFDAHLALAREALGVAEDDDALFFRAQRVVRRALLARGAALVASGLLDEADEVFELPLAQALGPDEDLRREARMSRQRRIESARLLPPARFVSGRPVWDLPGGPLLRGHPVPGPGAGRIRGRAMVLRSLGAPALLDRAERAELGAILVLPALLPSWAPLLSRAGALVTDSGGPLCHGATLAREAGVPAVVGTRAATRTIREGDMVIVDAVRGLVYKSGDEQTGSAPGTVKGR
jgi:pyruvate,water dikinase